MRASFVSNGTLSVTALIAVAALSILAWRSHAELARLNESLSDATQRIDQLNGALSKAREELNDTRAALDSSVADAEQARETQAQSSVSAPVHAPAPLPSPSPTSPLEMAQLQASQTMDPLSDAAEAVLQLKGRH